MRFFAPKTQRNNALVSPHGFRICNIRKIGANKNSPRKMKFALAFFLFNFRRPRFTNSYIKCPNSYISRF